MSLSADPKNLTGEHSFKAHSLAQPSLTVTLEAPKDGKRAIVLGKSGAKAAAVKLSQKAGKGATAGSLAIIEATVGKAHFRPDQQRAALARFARLASAEGRKVKDAAAKLPLGGRYQRAGTYGGKTYTFENASAAASPRHVKAVRA